MPCPLRRSPPTSRFLLQALALCTLACLQHTALGQGTATTHFDFNGLYVDHGNWLDPFTFTQVGSTVTMTKGSSVHVGGQVDGDTLTAPASFLGGLTATWAQSTTAEYDIEITWSNGATWQRLASSAPGPEPEPEPEPEPGVPALNPVLCSPPAPLAPAAPPPCFPPPSAYIEVRVCLALCH